MPVRKPTGPTSHDVVDQVRRALGVERVGHLGTLDPFASGVLVVVTGRATRLARFATTWAKAYDGAIRLGVRTSTDDRTGDPIATSDAWRTVHAEAVLASFGGLRGRYAQRPPAYSAVKVAGERAYRRARRGEAVALAARPVEVRELELVAFEPPVVRFRAVVGAGTYLRSVARDIGQVLGCGAHLAELERTAVGPFDLAASVAPEGVGEGDLRDPGLLVAELARRELTPDERTAAVHGRPIPAAGVGAGSDPVALFAGHELVAIAEREGDALHPRVVLGDA